MGLFWLVVLKRLEKEGRRRLNHVLGHEDVDNAFHVNQGASFVFDELGRKFGAFLGVYAHDALQETDIVRGVTSLLRIQNDLLCLASLGEARNNLVRYVGTKVDGECEGHVEWADNVAELLTACKLVLLQPLLQQLLATLL